MRRPWVTFLAATVLSSSCVGCQSYNESEKASIQARTQKINAFLDKQDREMRKLAQQRALLADLGADESAFVKWEAHRKQVISELEKERAAVALLIVSDEEEPS